MVAPFQHLGPFSDWVAAAREHRNLYPVAAPGEQTRQRVREVVGFVGEAEHPRDVRVEGRWERDGVAGEALSWSAGYGPRPEAWLLKPGGADTPLPGVVALHDHGGFKFYGKEKIADGPDGPAAGLAAPRARYYGGRCPGYPAHPSGNRGTLR